MLTAKNISCQAGKKVLLENVSLVFYPGKINLVLGPNGAGKTTLLKILAGQLRHYTGEVMYGFRKLEDFSPVELARQRAVLSQHTELAFPLTVEEVIMMGRYPHFDSRPARRDREATAAAINLFGLEEFRKRDYLTLSGGEKQRVQFARVISQVWYPIPGHCRYLLLDEPLSFLDIHYQLDFMHKIQTLLADGDLLVAGIIHDLHLAARFADHAIVLQNGKLIAAGDRETVFTAAMIQQAYDVKVEVEQSKNGLRISY